MIKDLYLCVHVPEFPAQALLRLRSRMKASAVAVLEGVTPLERVCSVNRKASAMGVRAGMTKAELDSFDDLIVLRRSPEEERVAKAAVLELMEAFTPRIEDHTAGPHATAGACVVVLDVSGMERLFGSGEQLAHRLQRALRELQVEARVAVSANLLTSIVLARAAAAEPRGAVRVVARGNEAATLAALPIESLKLTDDQIATFATWGLRTVGELAALDEVDVVIRSGQEGARLWRLSQGCAEHLLVPVEAGLQLEEVVELDSPVDGMQPLLFLLGPMLDQLIARAGNRAMELASVRVEMQLESQGEGTEKDAGSDRETTHVRIIKPALPVADRVLLLKLLHLDLEAHPPADSVVRLRVTAEAGGRSKAQAGLFSPPLPEAGRLEVTLARLAGLVGEQWVGRARLLDSHAPESFAMEKFQLPAAAEFRRTKPQKTCEDRLQWQQKEAERRKHDAGCDEESSGTQRGLPSAMVPRSIEEDLAVSSPRRPVPAQGTASLTKIKISDVIAPATLEGSAERDAACCPEQGQSKVLHFTALKPDTSIKQAFLGNRDVGSALLQDHQISTGEGDRDVANPRCAVAVRRMRPPVPIKWKGVSQSAFWMQGVLYDVRERHGPWRLSGAWWTGAVWSQEEWDVTVEAGGGVRLLCVLTHDLLLDRWHMDSIYD